MSGLRRIIREVHRRSLWQVLGIYLAASWVALQVAQGLAQSAGLPAWFPSFALALLVIGLPIVLATAFVQEGGPGGGQDHVASEAARAAGEGAPPVPIPPPAAARRLLTWRNALGGGILAFALWGVIAAGWLFLGPGRTGSGVLSAGPAGKSVAVLPFANMSPEKENEYFSDGITDDIITQLTKIGDLKVISRTSVMGYKGAGKNLREIGRELGVATILEGGVRREGNRVRLNAQLIDARTDEHLWAETYEREITDIFAVQADLALQIAGALRATLAPAERERIEGWGTADAEAYSDYLRGREHLNRGRQAGNLRLAREMFERAVERDPAFALAWAWLAQAHAQLYWFGHDHTEERLALAKDAAERALSLDPELPEARTALGLYHYWGRLDYERALAELERVLRARPGDLEALVLVAAIRRRQGDLEGALELFRRGRELDPRNPGLLIEMGNTFVMLRRFSEGLPLYDRAEELRPEYGFVYEMRAWALVAAGDMAGARAALRQGVETGAEVDPHGEVRWYVEMAAGDAGSALAALSPESSSDDYSGVIPASLRYAETYRALGDEVRARAYADTARAFLESRLAEEPGDARVLSSLGLAYAWLGRREEAMEAGRRAVELVPPTREAFQAEANLERLARVYVYVGEPDSAVASLGRLLAIPGFTSAARLRVDPVWETLRGHPAFQRLLAAEPTPEAGA